jgi:PAS domain S-box-containing protein
MSDGATTTAAGLEVSSSALVESLFAGAEFGLAVLDADLRFARVNAALAHADGLAVDDHVGKTMAELWPGGAVASMRAARQVLETGRPVRDLRVSVRPREAGAERSFDCSIYPIAEDGEVVGVWTALREVTEDRPAVPVPGADGEATGVLVVGQETTEAVRRRQALEQELEDEHRIVTQLQVSLMPDRLPSVPGADMASAFRPAGDGHEIGGDFFDVFPMGPECWMMVIGDVCGKGAEAAALTALARYTLRAAAIQEGAEPAELLVQLNEAVMLQRDDTRFLTAVCAFLESGESDEGLRITLSVAGHPSPLKVSAAGVATKVGGLGALIGVWDAPDLREEVIHLRQGERLVLYTDGVVEAGAPSAELGDEGLAQLLADTAGQSAAATVAAIEEAVLSREKAAPRDDLAVLVVRPDPERDR